MALKKRRLQRLGQGLAKGEAEESPQGVDALFQGLGVGGVEGSEGFEAGHEALS